MKNTRRRLDVSGAWFGRYFYPDVWEPAVPFFANFEEGGAGDRGAVGFFGSISEPNSIDTDPPQLHAIVAGSRMFDAAMFRKLYDGEGDLAHAVQYNGLLSEDGTRLAGTWSFEWFEGTFEMSRPTLEEIEQEVEREADNLLPIGR